MYNVNTNDLYYIPFHIREPWCQCFYSDSETDVFAGARSIQAVELPISFCMRNESSVGQFVKFGLKNIDRC